MDYRKLTIEEIRQLEQQSCLSDDWGKVLVKESFAVNHIFHTRFSGEIRLGVFEKVFELEGGLRKHSGLRHVTLHNCSVGDNTLIENVPNHISNYNIGEDCFIQNVNLIVVDGETCFGNGVQVSVLNETGGREVPIFNKLSAHLAYLIALYRHRPLLIEKLQMLIEKYSRKHSSFTGSIGRNVKIINTGTIRNLIIGDGAIIDGASRLENGTLSSNMQAPIHIGHNVIASDFIVCSGAHITDGAVLVRTFVGQACHLGHLFSAHDSLFFANCQGENGEACAIFAGAYTVSMHKSSLLIACMFSFLNAGSGSNQSNHMYKLGPIHQGIVERGSKTTSDSYILWPARIGAFSLVMGRHVNHPDTSELPFSYLIENKDETYLVPGVNLRSVGTIRDSQKWPKRDKRTDDEKLDFINFNLLSPYTVSRMMRGVELLKNLQDLSGETSAEYAYQSTHIRNSALKKGIQYYNKAIDKFFGNSLISHLQKADNYSIGAIRAHLTTQCGKGEGEWLDISGLIVPKSEISHLISRIENDGFEDITDIHKQFEELHNHYYEMEWQWAASAMQGWYGVDFSKVTKEELVNIIKRWMDAVVSLDRLLYEDAHKEFSMVSQVGFGVDGAHHRRVCDFEQVRGSFEQNQFVVSVLKHIETKSNLGKEMINKLL
ncbi:hypothetical protein BN938_2740 [Mucinivorans hirudinis]|uniref:DUF4954 domain-containing protein n=1 Tax=Mucinivorans hirudinis TaxID=1433126 RepID=A0A060REM3_9BACT|nr:hypothetical protein BN938_2740 [Mucinivorans hirudinis]